MTSDSTAYEDALRIVCEIVQSQQMWQSPRMLREDLKRALAVMECEPTEVSKSVPTVHGGNCGTTPFYLFPGQCSPEYDQGHSVVVWYDDLYDLVKGTK